MTEIPCELENFIESKVFLWNFVNETYNICNADLLYNDIENNVVTCLQDFENNLEKYC